MKNMAIVNEVRTESGLFGGNLKDTPSVDLKFNVVKKIIAGIKQIQAGIVQNSSRQATAKASISYEIPSFETKKSSMLGLSDVNLSYQVWFYNRKNN